MSNQIVLFSYNELAEQDQAFIKQKTEQIKTLMTRTVSDIIKIGQSLIEVKSRLEHGQFGAWLETEFEMTNRTARNFMNVAARFKTETVSDLRIATAALYLLASPSTSSEARDAAIDMAKAGERVTRAKAKVIINEYKPKPEPEPAKPEVIASAPLTKTPKKKQEEPSMSRCKNTECGNFGLEWSRRPQYGVGLYCPDCLIVNKAMEQQTLEQFKAGKVNEGLVAQELGVSIQTLHDKMDVAFGQGWRDVQPEPPITEVPPAPALFTIKTVRGVYQQTELVPSQPIEPAQTLPKINLLDTLPSSTASIPVDADLTVTMVISNRGQGSAARVVLSLAAGDHPPSSFKVCDLSAFLPTLIETLTPHIGDLRESTHYLQI